MPTIIRLRFMSYAFAMTAAIAALPVSAAAPAVEVFGALPAETGAVLSPDGHWLAWLDQKEPKQRIVIVDVSARKVQRMEPVPANTRLRTLRWSDSDTLLATFGQGFLTIAIPATGQRNAVLLPTEKGWAFDAMRAQMVRTAITKPHTVIMSIGGDLLEVDTITGKRERIKFGNEHTVGWAVDRDGRPLAREDWDWKSSAYRVYALKGDAIKQILRKDDTSAPTLVGLLPDDSALVLLSNNGRPHQAAWALPLDGSPQRLLVEDPDADITAVYTDAHTGAIVGAYVSGTKTDVHWLDPAAQHRQEVLQHSFPNQQVSVYGWTRDGSKTLARVESPSSPPIYYLVDFASHTADIAAEEYPALAGVKLGELKEITYKARDGTEIPAYLTIPPESAEPGPLVVLPHGGPNERDYPTFDWVVQFLVSRGYAVLQPQFRGSRGFGDAYEKAGYRQWGGLMQDDVSDGVRAMIEQRVADPKHICIVGMSYGGYAALAGAAFTPNLYSCAISVNGISDIRALLNNKVPAGVPGMFRIVSSANSVWRERIGTQGDSALDKKSPIHSVASIIAPVLIVYGNDDSVVPNTQSTEMAKALNAAAKRVTLVKLADEDHWLSRTDTRVQMLQAFESFLRDNL